MYALFAAAMSYVLISFIDSDRVKSIEQEAKLSLA